jgi:hypothetical protein
MRDKWGIMFGSVVKVYQNSRSQILRNLSVEAKVRQISKISNKLQKRVQPFSGCFLKSLDALIRTTTRHFTSLEGKASTPENELNPMVRCTSA